MLWQQRLVFIGLIITVLAMSTPSPATTQLAVLTTRMPVAPANRHYSFQLYATGGTAPYTWTVNGLQGSGLSANSGGTISGTPNRFGNYNVQITVQDASQEKADGSFILTVYDGGLPGAISDHFFGVHVLSTSDWPQVPSEVNPFGVVRLWDTGTAWAQIERVQGSPRWDLLDTYTKLAQADGVGVLYVLGLTPTWASSDPQDTTCTEGKNVEPGSCDAPADWQTFDDFVTTLVSRYTETGVQTGCTVTNPQCNGTIRIYELWNEPYIVHMWNPAQKQYNYDPNLTMQAFVKMTQDAQQIIKSIDPQAVVASPPGTAEFFGQYWATPGAVTNFDRVDMHAYPLPSIPVPELMIHQTAQVVDVMKKYQITSPLMNTEGSYGHFPPKLEVDQAAYAARYVLLEAAMKMRKSLWYTWTGLAPLWDSTKQPGALTSGGGGYQEVAAWLLGANMLSSGCLDKSGNFQANIYLCTGWNGTYIVNLGRGQGYKGQVVWFLNTVQGGGVDWRATTTYKVPAGFTQYVDLNGNVHRISGSTIMVGDSPILLQNKTIAGQL